MSEGLYFGECPRWHDGRLWYSDFLDHAVHALAPGGADERVVEVAAQPAGLGWMPDGSLLVVSMTDRRVLRLGADGSLGEHADLASWAPFHCNDMVVDGAGRAYVGNFGFDIYPLLAGKPGQPRPTVLIRVDPDGQVGGPDGCELFAMTAPTAIPAEASVSARGRIESARVGVGHAGLP